MNEDQANCGIDEINARYNAKMEGYTTNPASRPSECTMSVLRAREEH